MAPEATGRQDAGAERAAAPRQDALELLSRDHREVEALFKRYAATSDAPEKIATAARVCLLLKAHARVEEEIFYPAARRRIEDKDLIEESLAEHKDIMALIDQIEQAGFSDANAPARMKALSDMVGEHVREEEDELFPEVRNAAIDLMGLGARLAELRLEALRSLGGEDAADAEGRSFKRDA